MDKEKIKQKMDEKNITLYKLSVESGLGYSTLHDIVVTGKIKNPRIDTLGKIAQALNESIESFI